MKSSLNTKIMELVYQLEGAGWADARISDGSRQLGMSVSYLSDALGDMAKAALHLLRGGREASFSFEDEPGQNRWLLTRGEADSLRIQIRWFDDTFSSLDFGRGKEVFFCECAVLDFAGQVHSVLHQVLEDEGAEGYKRRWTNHDFPAESFAEIQKLLTPDAQ